MNNIDLKTKLVGELEGDFIIPAYQRGYRWNEEVKMLLDDLSEIPEGANYCLQPIVVKKLDNDKYELIDGQQRLTTLLLIYKYMASLNLPFKQKFSLEYEIRKNSRVFLDAINESVLGKTADNIDEYFIIEAYRTIRDWFQAQSDQPLAAFNLYKKFGERISVIWYEIDSNEDAISLFTRLNIGKIPLTNAELVKAIFLSRNNGVDERYQLEISTQWDTMENELHDDGFWYFITNKKADLYPTRIELLFDLMANKADDDKERLRTFFWFMDQVKSDEFKDKKINLWKQVIENFQRLKEWYKDHELYHKIGYIIAARQETLSELKSKSSTMSKTAFRDSLDRYIAESIRFKKDFQELSYTNDYNDIEKLLLLFNVESVRQNGDKSMRFPFDKHKKQAGGWSLEHIHAQQSQGMNKQEQWNEWLNLHVISLRNIDAVKHAELIAEIEQRDRENINGEQFEELFKKIIDALEFDKNLDYINALENMALLGKFENSALNNSTFDVKRDKILEMDKRGDYIPICTRRVFLKYYTPSDKNQLHFWGEEDRKAYMKAMNEVLKSYLSIIGKELYHEH